MMWWLSFCDPDLPEGHSFLGVAIVPANTDDIADAVEMAWQLDCNPGGQVLGCPLKNKSIVRIPDNMIARLLNADEACAAVKMIEAWTH